MIYSFSELCKKDVINIENGENLGFIDDVVFESCDRKIKGFVIYGRKRLYGFLGLEKSFFISCEEIKLIGKDVILIETHLKNCDILQKSYCRNLRSLLKKAVTKLLK